MTGLRGINTVSEVEARANLAELLRGAVPIHMARVAALPPEKRHAYQPHGWQAMVGRADTMLFASQDRQKAAAVVDTYARGLAVAAFSPGGVSLFGAHWCAGAHEGCPNVRPRQPIDVAATLAQVHRLLDEYEALVRPTAVAA